MLPELILKEEEKQQKPVLAALGFFSGLVGYGVATTLFPSQKAMLTVIFASIPLIYPLTSYFLEREDRKGPHWPEIKVYGSLFLGEVAAFFLLGMVYMESFSLQLEVVGAAGYAVKGVTFYDILVNNLLVFTGILVAAAVIGSAGAFILTWNASVLGVFLATIFEEQPVGILAYLPHATLEMTGFIVAGVSGSMISAAVYREHFDRDTWKDFARLMVSGVALIVLGAMLETA